MLWESIIICPTCEVYQFTYNTIVLLYCTTVFPCDKIMVLACTFRCIPIPRRNFASPRSTVPNLPFSFSITCKIFSSFDPESKMWST